MIPPPAASGQGRRPDHTLSSDQATAAVGLLRRFFLNRIDKVAVAPPWDAAVCPAEGGANLDAMLRAHVGGGVVKVRWAMHDRQNWTNYVRPCRVGTYSPALDGTTVFAVIDFDGGPAHGSPLADPTAAALAFLCLCLRAGLAAYLEKSKSGKGWHVWLFFAGPLPAREVRRLLCALLDALRPAPLLAPGSRADWRARTGIEVFPGQDELAPDGPRVGHQVWLPFYGGAGSGGCQFHAADDAGNLTPYLPDTFVTVSAGQVAALLAELAPTPAAAPAPARPANAFAVAGKAGWDLVLSALAGLNTNDRPYDEWLAIGFICFNVNRSDAGLVAWVNWSKKSAKHRDGACEKEWRGFRSRPEGVNPATGRPWRLGAGTLFRLAAKDGWHRPGPAPRRRRGKHALTYLRAEA
jgi:hypothetical protein